MVSSSPKRLAWVVSLLLAVGLIGGLGSGALAQEQPARDAVKASGPAAAPAEGAAAPEAAKGAMGLPLDKVPAELQKNFADLVHYYRIARFDLAAPCGEAIAAANPEPTVLLALVEHPDVGYALVVEMSAADDAALSQAVRKLIAIADMGVYIKRKDGQRIADALTRLGKNERAYELGLRELQYSGEYVAPYALGFLADSSRTELHAPIKRALREIGRPVVYPLVVALETPDETLKLTVIDLLGSKELGYRMALPALKALVESPEASEAVKAAAKATVEKIAGPNAANESARKLYYDLADALYHDRENRFQMVPDVKRAETDVWGWVPGSGLAYRPAPTQAVHDILAARAAELGLRADPKALEMVSLWVSIQMQLKTELMTGGSAAKNPWAPATIPTTEFFARAVGQQYLMEVLDRALREQNVTVAIQAIRALELVANEGYLRASTAGQGSPLVRALEYPDRTVRFGAAFAIVAVQPKQAFFGAERVVPVLAEALSLESGQGILIIDANQENVNRLKGQFRQAGWNVGDATTGNDGLSRAFEMPRLDAVLVASNVQNVSYVEVIRALRENFVTTLVPIVLLSGEAERVTFSDLKQTTKYIDQVSATAAAAEIVTKIGALQAQTGSTALDPKQAAPTSLRAAHDLSLIAAGGLALKAMPARASLLAAVGGKNEALAIAVMEALVQMPDPEVQQRLADVALAAGASKPVRVAALSAAARVARHIGNKLQEATVAELLKRAASEQDNDVRDAVGTLLGALDLEPEQASKFILEQATGK